MAVHTPLLVWQPPAFNAVAELHQRVAREARAENGGDMIFCPADNINQRISEGFLVKRWIGDVGSGDNQRVETLIFYVVEA